MNGGNHQNPRMDLSPTEGVDLRLVPGSHLKMLQQPGAVIAHARRERWAESTEPFRGVEPAL